MSALVQVCLAVFGLASLWMALGNNARARRWAPIVGLIGQPFWVAFAVGTQAWGLMLLVAAYTFVYARGAWGQWDIGARVTAWLHRRLP